MATTDNFQIPYPAATEPIAQGAETIRQGTERIDDLFAGAGVEHFTNIGSPSDSGWGMTGLRQEAWITGPRVDIFFEVRRAGPSLSGGAQGGLGDTTLFTVPNVRLQTPRVITNPATYLWGAATYGGHLEYWGASVVLCAITPGTEVTRNDNAGAWSVRGSLSFIRPV